MKLALWLEDTRTKPADFAKRCRVNMVTVYKWKNGAITPRPAQMAAIAAATSNAVTANDFVHHDLPSVRLQKGAGLQETQASFVTEALALGLDAKTIAAKALQDAISAERQRLWIEEHRDAFAAHNEWVEKHGVPLAKYRMF